jgi:soluble lytic murein transglycosylase-like protein
MKATPELLQMADAAANSAGIPVDVFRGLIERESSWNPSARSGAGAVGLAQVMPFWANSDSGRSLTGLRSVDDLFNPFMNLQAGARILASEIQRFGSVPLALMAYNAGSPAVTRAISATKSKDPLTVETRVPVETRAYWRAVLNWGAAWGGNITRIEAQVRNKTGDLTASVLSWASTPQGKATSLMILAVLLGGALILGGRRAG